MTLLFLNYANFAFNFEEVGFGIMEMADEDENGFINRSESDSSSRSGMSTSGKLDSCDSLQGMDQSEDNAYSDEDGEAEEEDDDDDDDEEIDADGGEEVDEDMLGSEGLDEHKVPGEDDDELLLGGDDVDENDDFDDTMDGEDDGDDDCEDNDEEGDEEGDGTPDVAAGDTCDINADNLDLEGIDDDELYCNDTFSVDNDAGNLDISDRKSCLDSGSKIKLTKSNLDNLQSHSGDNDNHIAVAGADADTVSTTSGFVLSPSISEVSVSVDFASSSKIGRNRHRSPGLNQLRKKKLDSAPNTTLSSLDNYLPAAYSSGQYNNPVLKKSRDLHTKALKKESNTKSTSLPTGIKEYLSPAIQKRRRRSKNNPDVTLVQEVAQGTEDLKGTRRRQRRSGLSAKEAAEDPSRLHTLWELSDDWEEYQGAAADGDELAEPPASSYRNQSEGFLYGPIPHILSDPLGALVAFTRVAYCESGLLEQEEWYEKLINKTYQVFSKTMDIVSYPVIVLTVLTYMCVPILAVC